jgi:hypothetical protein
VQGYTEEGDTRIIKFLWEENEESTGELEKWKFSPSACGVYKYMKECAILGHIRIEKLFL